jgi:hypothetical protein
MKEGRLSSDLLERYGISEQNAIGKVLWHSLNENGDIGVYDMKFGNTIVRNLTENELLDEKCPPHCNETKHGAQNENEAARGNAGAGEEEADDVTRILTPRDLKLINTNPEFIKALKIIINHASFIPQGKTILTRLLRQLPKDIQTMKK